MDLTSLIQPVVDWVLTLPKAVHVATFAVAASSLGSALFPTIKNNSKYVWVQKILDIVALNLAHAKDKGTSKDK